MATLGYFVLGIAALPYIIIPILIWFTQRFSCSIKLRRVEENFLPAEVLKEFHHMTDALSKRLFEMCLDAYTNDESLGLRFYHRVLLSKVHRTWAICTAISDDGGKLHRKYLELKSQFIDHTSLSTHNSDLIGAPINAPNRKLTPLPSMTEPNILLDIHLLRLKKVVMEEIVDPPSAEAAFETLQKFVNQDQEEQAALGAIYMDENEKMYRPTWAGAVLIGWYSMWPLTYLRRINSQLRIRNLMKELASTNS